MDRDRMDALLATTAARVGRSWLLMGAHLRETNTVEAITERVARLQFDQAIAGIDAAAAAFAGGEHAAYVHGGQATARWLRERVPSVEPRVEVEKKLLTFDAASPSAAGWAQRNRLDKIREISDELRAMVHGVLLRGARAGTSPRVMAAEIRDSIGLTAYQEQIVANYRAQLEHGGAALQAALDRELTGGHADKTLIAAIRDARAIPAARIDSMVDAYRRNWQAYRAGTITRTEGLRVAHQASAETFDQAVTAGDIRAEQIERKWVHTERRGKESRDYHASMNGQVRAYGEPFVSGLGHLLMFPCDPSAPLKETAGCTCVVTTRIRR